MSLPRIQQYECQTHHLKPQLHALGGVDNNEAFRHSSRSCWQISSFFDQLIENFLFYYLLLCTANVAFKSVLRIFTYTTMASSLNLYQKSSYS